MRNLLSYSVGWVNWVNVVISSLFSVCPLVSHVDNVFCFLVLEA